MNCLRRWSLALLILAAPALYGGGDAGARARSDNRAVLSGTHTGIHNGAQALPERGPSSPAPSTPLPLPDKINDGDTIDLDCGRIYAGTLNLSGRHQVTVRTVGDCGPAVITPSRPIERWRRDNRDPQLWIAEWPSAPLLLELEGRYLPLAHYPNARTPWAQGVRVADQRLRVKLPSTDLVGANLVWRAADWLIQERRIAQVEDQVLNLAAGDDEGFGLLPQTAFYVEGKRWMIDTPGEWAWHEGLLFLRMPDRGSPAGRIRALSAGPVADTLAISAISARDAQDITIDGILIRTAAIGIDGSGSQRLTVRDTRIIHSIDAAIIAGSGSEITRVQVEGTVRHGIRADDDARAVRITDSQIRGAGMLGMPKRSKGAIVFEQAQGQQIRGNRISDAAYIGIRVFRHAQVSDNLIERACQRLSDCGGIYTFARDHAPLHVVIERNRIHALGGDTSFGIYLDDFANGVVVRENVLSRNPSGMQLHNGFRNRIERNRFIDSRREHLLFNETAELPVIDGNQVTGNRFHGPASVPVFRLWSRHGGAHVARFAHFGRNVYAGAPRRMAEIEGQGLLDSVQWRQWSGERRQSGVQAGTQAGVHAGMQADMQVDARAPHRSATGAAP